MKYIINDSNKIVCENCDTVIGYDTDDIQFHVVKGSAFDLPLFRAVVECPVCNNLHCVNIPDKIKIEGYKDLTKERW